MVQIHPTPTWYSGMPPPPRVDWLQLHSPRNSEQTPSTTTLCLQRAAPSVWGCGEDFDQVSRYISDTRKIVFRTLISFVCYSIELPSTLASTLVQMLVPIRMSCHCTVLSIAVLTRFHVLISEPQGGRGAHLIFIVKHARWLLWLWIVSSLFAYVLPKTSQIVVALTSLVNPSYTNSTISSFSEPGLFIKLMLCFCLFLTEMHPILSGCEL